MTAKETNPAFPYVVDITFQAGDIIFATDKQGLVVYWNKEAEEISGNKAAEALGQPYTIACRMEPGFNALDIVAVLGGRDFAGGVRCHSRSGAEAALYLFATVGRNRSGEAAGGVVFVGRDVTGLWRAGEAAQASTDKYRVLFENTQDSVAIADIGGRVLEANPACLRLYGYTVDEVKAMNLTDVVAPEDRGAAKTAMASLALGRSVTKTIRMRRKDGTKFVVDLLASVIMVRGERRIMSVTRDVTERVRAEQAKSQSERMYRAVFESANDAVFIESVDGRILDVNRHGCELLGYRRSELLKMTVSDLVPAEARAWLPHVIDAILRERTFRTEAVNVHKSGCQIPVEMSASTMELDGRTVVLAIVRDITKRKLNEQALRESEERFRDVSEQSPNMIFVNSRGRVVYANQKSVDVMGYTREEFYAPGFDFMKLIAPESVERINSVYARHARGEEVEPYEYTLVTKAGGRVESILTTKLIDFDGDKAVLGIAADITERRRAERSLRQEQELARSYLEVAGVMMVVLDETGAVRLINRKGCAVLDGTPGDIVGRNWFDTFVPERLRAEVKRGFEGLMRGVLEPMEYYENPVVTLRGEERLIAWHNALLRDEAGRVVGTLSSGNDITERTELAREAAAAAAQAQAVLDNSPGAVVGECEGVLVYANRRFARLLGYDSPAEVIGRPAGEFDAPQDRDLLAGYSRMREQGEDAPTSYSYHGLRRDGTIVPLEATVSTYRSLGRLHVLAFLREVEPARGDR